MPTSRKREDHMTNPRHQIDHETERLAALRRSTLLHEADDPIFDQVSELATRLLDSPIGCVTVVDAQYQWFKASTRGSGFRIEREQSFCTHTIASDDVLVVPDMHCDARFTDNPFVTGEPFVRFYAGAPLVFDGKNLGSLCVLDTKPRSDFGETEKAVLKELADFLRIKQRKVYDLAASGNIPCSRAMGKLLFPRAEIEAWVARGMTAGGMAESVPAGFAAPARNRPGVFLGSHDPLLDWALRQSRCGLATFFDGSLDGLDRYAAGEGLASWTMKKLDAPLTPGRPWEPHRRCRRRRGPGPGSGDPGQCRPRYSGRRSCSPGRCA